jgi:phosphohistidine phosphatase
MNLYILRHASAGVRRADPALDAKRPLDKEGKEQCLLIARHLNALRIQFDLIVSSPLKRALQTASLVGTEVAYDSKIQITEAVSPSGSLSSFQDLIKQLSAYDSKIQITEAVSPSGSLSNFQDLIKQLSAYDNVLVVGHNPNLPEFVGSLVCSPGRANLRMRKGAIARVDCTRRPGQLVSLVDPRMLRQLYASAAKSSRRNTSRK